MSTLNFVDIIIILIFLSSMVYGFGRGFVREIISLGSLLAAFFIAASFASALAANFTNSPSVQGLVNQASNSIGVNASQPVSYVALGLSFLLLFGGTLIVGAIVGYILNMFFQTGFLGLGNRLLGGLFGLGRGFIINLVLIFLIQLSPLASEPWWGQSHFVQAYQPAVQWLGTIVSPALINLKARLSGTIQGVENQIQNVTSGSGL